MLLALKLLSGKLLRNPHFQLCYKYLYFMLAEIDVLIFSFSFSIILQVSIKKSQKLFKIRNSEWELMWKWAILEETKQFESAKG